ncbi:head-tail connector protein [Paenirhodobacter sp. CAU 1674]|uniref:head-tail connector protein n=1 Tax=Paenirhodobacter sp. CAU 1674 TaxID=3032596 RepID=UPI0023DB1AF2|nr:head-tail connector protein [Paenirhodobacter sp. CAU 1674]MDF2140803.1 head-tail connector protein [Paenirhodobacter sp. CAU 1674]
MTLATDLLSQAKLHARIDHDDEDAALSLMIDSALGDVLAAATAGEVAGGWVDLYGVGYRTGAIRKFSARTKLSQKRRGGHVDLWWSRTRDRSPPHTFNANTVFRPHARAARVREG